MIESNAQVLSQSHPEQIRRCSFICFLANNILYNVAIGIISSTTVIPGFVSQLTEKLTNYTGAIWFFVHRYNATLSV